MLIWHISKILFPRNLQKSSMPHVHECLTCLCWSIDTKIDKMVESSVWLWSFPRTQFARLFPWSNGGRLRSCVNPSEIHFKLSRQYKFSVGFAQRPLLVISCKRAHFTVAPSRKSGTLSKTFTMHCPSIPRWQMCLELFTKRNILWPSVRLLSGVGFGIGRTFTRSQF
jgi:hypothetical protein